MSNRWNEHNQRKDHQVKDEEGECEPDGWVTCIDAMSCQEDYIEVKDFIKHQAGVKYAKRKAEILKFTPKIRERQIIAATSAALTEILADKT